MSLPNITTPNAFIVGGLHSSVLCDASNCDANV